MEEVRKSLKEMEKELKEAEELINKLRQAGEDVTALTMKYRQVKDRLERWKRAFEV